MTGAAMLMTTCGSPEEAATIAQTLVRERLAACVQRLSVDSVYEWRGALEAQPEILLLIKTREDLQDKAAARIRALHSYDTPEIIAAPITFADASYLAWLKAQTAQPD